MSGGSKRTWVVVAAGATLATATATAGERTLVELAEAYRTAERERAVAETALRSRDGLEREAAQLATLASRSPSWSTTRLGAIALLTESALVEHRAGAFSGARWRVLSAARLMEAAPPTTRDSAFERRFYLLAGLALHAGAELEPGYALLERGLKLVDRRDPELLTAQGAVIETVAALRRYDRPDARGGPPQPGGFASESGGRGSLPSVSLADAETRYYQALALDPDLSEARLRLGRVRLLRGRTREALHELDRVAAEARRPDQRYMARLLGGRALEALGDVPRAVAAYRAADAQVPQAQTALLALGRALDRLGDNAGAQAALDRASALGGPDDPWWNYQSGQPARLDDLLAELRRLAP